MSAVRCWGCAVVLAVLAWGCAGPAVAGEAPRGPVCNWDFEGTLRDERGGWDWLSAWDAGGQVVVPRFASAEEAAGPGGQAVALGVKEGDPAWLAACTSEDVRLGPSYTVALWLRATKLDGWARLVLCWGPGAEHAYHVAVHNGQASLYHGEADGEEAICEGGKVEVGRWHHLAAVAERNDAEPAKSALRIYLDGQCVATAPYDGTWRSQVGEGLGIGDSASAPSDACRFHGYLDGVMLWARPLAAAEVAALCAEGLKALRASEATPER